MAEQKTYTATVRIVLTPGEDMQSESAAADAIHALLQEYGAEHGIFDWSYVVGPTAVMVPWPD